MIDFKADLVARIHRHSRAILSVSGRDGYPISIPLPFHFNDGVHTFTMPASPQGLTLPTAGRTSLTLLYCDVEGANERFLAFQGKLTRTEQGYRFTPMQLILPPWERR